MAEIANVTFTFTDFTAPTTPRIMHIPDVAGDVTIQDLIDTLSARQADIENQIYAGFMINADTAGKQQLSVTKQNGLTLTLNNMQIKFPDQGGPGWVIKRVLDGNIVAVDWQGDPMEPLENSDFTNWKVEADVSAALIDGGFTTDDRSLVEGTNALSQLIPPIYTEVS